MEPYPLGKPVIDVANFEAHELVLNLEGEEPFDEQFTNVIAATRQRCTEGGEEVGGKSTVHENVDVPVVLMKLLFFELQTCFLVHKGRLYIYSMTIDEVWYLCSDSPFAIMGGLDIGFNSSYQGKTINNNAGPAALLSVLNMPADEITPREKAFSSLCLHFPESCRFTAYENFIRDVMSGNDINNQVEFTPKLQKTRTCWSDLSNCWRLWCRTKAWKLDAEVSATLKIENASQLAQNLAVLCP